MSLARRRVGVRCDRDYFMIKREKPEGVINRVYKYKLKPRPAHIVAMTEMLRTQCYLYNRALEFKTKAYEVEKQTVSHGDLKKKFITQGRKENEFLARCNYGLCAQTLKRLDLAYQAFFRRIKKATRPVIPSFNRHTTGTHLPMILTATAVNSTAITLFCKTSGASKFTCTGPFPKARLFAT